MRIVPVITSTSFVTTGKVISFMSLVLPLLNEFVVPKYEG